ncbi:MAG: AMP-binding protein [Pseudonocardiales bacterium]|nr:AMP-binding protein [Pseudonocardiales bacterium]
MTMNILQRPVASRALDAATLCEAFRITVATCPQRVALRTPGDAVVVTWEQYAERVRRTAAGLAALGVRRGDTVAFMLTNRPEFCWVDVAAMHLGATAFGVYNTFAQEQVEHVLRDANCAVVITEQAFANTLEQARRACPQLTHIVSVDGGENLLSLDEVDAAGDPAFDLASTWPAVQPDDVVTLIYTSGTTGPPKGVQLTHASAMANARAQHLAIPAFRDGFSVVSYLPLAHISARVFEHYVGLVLGATLTCCADLDRLPATLVDARPTWFSDPRGSGKSARRACWPPSAPNRMITVGEMPRRRSSSGYACCAPNRPASSPPLRCVPRTSLPMRWCCPGCGNVSASIGSKPLRSGPPRSHQK